MKEEEIEVTYSFWDGNGHRKVVTVCLSFSLSLCASMMRRLILYSDVFTV